MLVSNSPVYKISQQTHRLAQCMKIWLDKCLWLSSKGLLSGTQIISFKPFFKLKLPWAVFSCFLLRNFTMLKKFFCWTYPKGTFGGKRFCFFNDIENVHVIKQLLSKALFVAVSFSNSEQTPVTFPYKNSITHQMKRKQVASSSIKTSVKKTKKKKKLINEDKSKSSSTGTTSRIWSRDFPFKS